MEILITNKLDIMNGTLIKNIGKKAYSRDQDQDFDNTEVYKVEGDGITLRYWNSSNSSGIEHREALDEMLDLVFDGDDGGSVTDGWNEIMFEVI